MIAIKNLCVGYDRTDIISDFSIKADKHGFTALVGPNGCGKSTLLKALIGALKIRAGEVMINGQSLTALTPRKRAAMMAYLAQNRDLTPGLTVLDLVELGRAPYRGLLGRLSKEDAHMIDDAMARTETARFKDRLVSELSGGERARVLLARALAVNANVILVDEPIAALDPHYQIAMMQTLKDEAMRGRTVIAALHDLSLAHQFSDCVWMMQYGNIIADGPPSEVLNDENLSRVFGVKPPKGGFQTWQRLPR